MLTVLVAVLVEALVLVVLACGEGNEVLNVSLQTMKNILIHVDLKLSVLADSPTVLIVHVQVHVSDNPGTIMKSL